MKKENGEGGENVYRLKTFKQEKYTVLQLLYMGLLFLIFTREKFYTLNILDKLYRKQKGRKLPYAT